MYGRFSFSVILLAFSMPVFAAETPSGAVVNGKAIPQSHIDFVAKARAAEGQPDTPELRKLVKEYLINREVLAQEAAKQGLDKDPELKMQIQLAAQSLLVANMVERFKAKHPISEQELRKEYDKQRAELGDTEYLPSHILVEDKAQAMKIIAQLKEGADFRVIAQEKTKDEATKKHGGGLQWSPASGFVEPFANAIVKLNKGEYTQEPVKTEHGWHVIKLDDRRPLQAPPFEKVRPQLAEVMQRQKIDQYIEQLRSKADIKTGS